MTREVVCGGDRMLTGRAAGRRPAGHVVAAEPTGGEGAGS